MIQLNLENSILFNIAIDILSIVITIIITISHIRNSTDTYDNRLMNMFQSVFLLLIMTDMIMWMLDGNTNYNIMHIMLYVGNILYYFFLEVIVWTWMKYSYYRIYGKIIPKKQESIFITIPFIIMYILIISSFWTSLVFYIDNNNVYHRGILLAPLMLFTLGYLIFPSFLALKQCKHEELPDRKTELKIIAFFTLPTIIGGIVQMIFYGLSIQWPCTVLSSVIAFLNLFSSSISKDPLTGMNNRRSLERYFSTFPQDKPLSILLLDINKFKIINDKLGHYLGDIALIEVGEILQSNCRSSAAFSARFGGDEFVIVLHTDNKSIIEKLIENIHKSFDDFNKTKKFQMDLTVSIGYSIAINNDKDRVKDCLKKADEHMYIKKAEFKLKNNL